MRASRARILEPLRERDFRLVWIGDAVSVLGDQFYVVALPWLVLQLAGSGLAVGTVLMLAAVPRAALMLAGGVASDRLSPRAIVVGTAVVRGILVSLVGWLVWMGVARLSHLYVLAFLFGVADAFAYPAFMTLVPLVAGAQRLAAANALLYAAAYVCLLAGPALGGVLIAAGGLSLAFVLDAISFFFSAALLLMIRPPASARGSAAGPARVGVGSQLAEALRAAWNDRTLRALILLVAAVNLAFAGPYTVGLSVLAKRVFGSVSALGVTFSAFGAGALLGSLLGGSTGRSIPLSIRIAVPCVGFCLAFPLLGFAGSLPVAAVLTGLLGLGGGFINVLLTSWIQLRAPGALLGRIMGLVMFASFGLQPISYAVSGLLIDRHLRATFVGAALLMAAATGWTLATGALAGMRETAKASPLAL